MGGVGGSGEVMKLGERRVGWLRGLEGRSEVWMLSRHTVHMYENLKD